VSDYIGAKALCGSLPAVERLIADQRCDATGSGKPCRTWGYSRIPGRTSRGNAVRHEMRRYKRRKFIELCSVV
jgi:hypothetical protein